MFHEYHVTYSARYYPRFHVTAVGLRTYPPWIWGSTCITYCQRVSVALSIRHAMPMRHIVICGLSGCTVFFPHCFINGTFFGKRLLNLKCMFWFSLQLLPENVLILGRVGRDMIIYRVSQEECARLRENVPYVKLYRYNPKHLYPKSTGYGDNSQRKVWSSSVSTYCTPSVTSYLSNAPARQLDVVMQWPWRVRYSAR